MLVNLSQWLCHDDSTNVDVIVVVVTHAAGVGFLPAFVCLSV